MSFSSLLYTKEGPVGTVTFNTPERLNAISEARLADLEAVLDAVELDHDLSALIITGGEARAYCVGLDLDLLDRAFDDIPYFESVVRRLNKIVTRLEALAIPTIAAVNGFARAGGFELSMGCDFILMADEALIGDVHTDAGVLPAMTSLRLARRIGEQRAKEIIWLAKWLSGQEAVAYGLAMQSVPKEQLQQSARQLALDLASKPKPCIASIKSVFQQGDGLSIAEGAELEISSFAKYMATEPYGKEGYRAYRESRLPFWKTA